MFGGTRLWTPATVMRTLPSPASTNRLVSDVAHVDDDHDRFAGQVPRLLEAHVDFHLGRRRTGGQQQK